MKIPVLFLIFNRKDASIKAFQAIKTYKPDQLFIAADGPRPQKEGEKEKCEETRQAVLEMIDWPCEVKTLFRDENLGCAKAVSSAIDWFFENVEFGIIVEDDIILSQDFFRLAQVIDSKYRDDDRIMCVNAQYIGPEHKIPETYRFSVMASPWGWATWRRAWKKMDMTMSLYPKIGIKQYIKSYGIVKGLLKHYYIWKPAYKIISSGGDISSWATRWDFNVFANNGLVVIPLKNLAVNIGCTGIGGAHYSADDENLYSWLKLESLPEEITHPIEIRHDKFLKKIENRDYIRVKKAGLIKKIKNKITASR